MCANSPAISMRSHFASRHDRGERRAVAPGCTMDAWNVQLGRHGDHDRMGPPCAVEWSRISPLSTSGRFVIRTRRNCHFLAGGRPVSGPQVCRFTCSPNAKTIVKSWTVRPWAIRITLGHCWSRRPASQRGFVPVAPRDCDASKENAIGSGSSRRGVPHLGCGMYDLFFHQAVAGVERDFEPCHST